MPFPHLFFAVAFSLISLGSPAPGYPRSRNLLFRYLLVALLCFATTLVCLVVVEQGRTIDSQRALIHQLFQDSLELNAARMKLVQKR